MKHNLILVCLTFSVFLFSQTKVIIHPSIRMPNDSIESKAIISSVNNFLNEVNKPNEEIKSVNPNEKLETYLEIDELKGIEKSERFKDEHFYKPYLTNLIKTGDSHYKIQLSYIGVKDNIPYLTASFLFSIVKEGNTFYFSSPLKETTQYWKSTVMDNYTFYYQNQLNIKTAQEYVKLNNVFEKKLKILPSPTKIYCAKGLIETLHIIGIDYKGIYNGYDNESLSSKSKNQIIKISSSSNGDFGKPELHDLWHARLHEVVPVQNIYKPLDEACAYLYAGSWDYTWQEILSRFKEKVANDKSKDWLTLYGKFENFGINENKHLYPEYVINALLVKKIEKEKGFDAVMEFLKCGKFDKQNSDNYFNALEKLTGITKKDYTNKVWELINKEK